MISEVYAINLLPLLRDATISAVVGRMWGCWLRISEIKWLIKNISFQKKLLRFARGRLDPYNHHHYSTILSITLLYMLYSLCMVAVVYITAPL